MKVTNKFNLPQPLVNAAKRELKQREYDHIRVTTLIKAPKPAFLRQKHWDEIEVDAIDSIWAIYGTGIHKALEEYEDRLNRVETTLTAPFHGVTIQGTLDLMTINEDDESIVIQDYKTTTAWASMQEKPEWETQLNVYAWLARQNDYNISGLNVIAIIKDWSRAEAGRDPSYPQSPVKVIPIDLWEHDLVTQYVKSRIELHTGAHDNHTFDKPLPDCTSDERWYRPGKYAVHNTAVPNRALKIFNTEDEAHVFALAYNAKKGTTTTIVSRSGKSAMCHGFCDVSKFCDQFQNKIKPSEIDTIVFSIDN